MVNPYIQAPASTCTYDGRTSRPIPTSPPVSVRTDRGVTVPARGSDGRARRTRHPANPCTLQVARDALVTDRTAARNRQKHLRHPLLKQQSKTRLSQIDRHLAAVDAAIGKRLAEDVVLPGGPRS